MANNRQSLSEQSQRRGNLILLIIGLVLLLLFTLALCNLPKKKQVVQEAEREVTQLQGGKEWGKSASDDVDIYRQSPGEGVLSVNPSFISTNGVVGKRGETEITLKAENADIKILSKNLLSEDEKGIALSGSCMEKGKDILSMNEECTIIVSWQSAEPRQLKNTIQIKWIEDNPRISKDEITKLPLEIQVMDSNPCVICKCDEKSKHPDPIPPTVTTLDGEIVTVDENGEVEINRKKYKVPEAGPVIDIDGEKVVAVVPPKFAPLNLKNELIGTVANNREVLDFDDKVIGRLLGDDTIVNEKLEVLGKAIPVAETMLESGEVNGYIVVDVEKKSVHVVDINDDKKVIGYPRVDGQVVDLDGRPLAFIAPYGSVISFNGDYLGGIVRAPDSFPQKSMMVLNAQKKVVGYMRPMGYAVNQRGEVVGGVVPSGIVVGGGCQSYGTIKANGKVYNNYQQHVGHVLLDNAVVDVNGNELGSVVRQGLVIDNSGKVVGFINSEGKAVDAKGAQIGCVNPDGSVFAKEKFVGALMPVGRVIRESCGQVGSVYPDAKVMSLDLQHLGKVLPGGIAIGNKKKLGWVAPRGTAIAKDCQLLGLISLNGTVVSTQGSVLGCLTRDNEVQNMKGDIIGMLTPTGIQMNEKNQIIGRVGLDGHIINEKGAVVGCVNTIQNVVISNSTRGVVIDENGLPTGWSFVAGKTYDISGAWMGDVTYSGWVIGDKHQLVGVVPFSGSVFSDRGEIVGQYNQMSGAVVNSAGQSIGRVLPGMTVINTSATEILGVLIPEKTVFVDMQGNILGTLRVDGVLVNQGQEVPAKILASGVMVDEKGQILGGRLPTGPVLNTAGKYIGLVGLNGDFVDEMGVKAGHVLANGLVVSEQKQVLGMVFPTLSTAVSTEGWLGSLNPQLIEGDDKVTYQGQVTDPKGNLLGKISAAGQVLGLDQNIKGSLIPVAPFMTLKGGLMGWCNFRGEVNSPEGRAIANILPSGLALSPAQQLQGVVVKPTAVVGTQGEYLGHTTSKGQLLSDKGEVLALTGLSRFVYDSQGVLLGQVLPPGIAVDADNNLIGWTRYDGQIEDGTKVIGQVGLDGHVFNEAGQMIGSYLPMGMTEFSANNNSSGMVNEKGLIQNVSGAEIAATATMPYVAAKAVLTGRLSDKSPFTASLNSSKNQGILSDDGKVYGLTSRRETGSTMSNGYTVGSAGLVDGAILPMGAAIGTTLRLLGQVYPDGNIHTAQKHVATTTGPGLVFSLAGELLGGVFKPGVIIDKKGAIVASSGATAAVMNKGKQVGNKMAFDSALTSTNNWLGNLMPRGATVDDMGNAQGVIALDGSVINAEGNFVGRVLPDGSVAGVPQRSVYNTMPYTGHTIMQGLPLSLKKEVLGRSDAMGKVLNHNNQTLGYVRDEGSIWSVEKKPIGLMIPFISAVDWDGKVLGTLSSDGKIVSYAGENMGKVAPNRAVKGSGEFEILGSLVPEDLIVRDCKVVGQTAYDGRVVNGQGAVVGRIQNDEKVVDSQGNEIGYIPKKGPVTTEKTGKYIGRILPDGIMVDVNGLEVACSNQDGELIDLRTGEQYFDPETGEGARVITRGLIFNKNGELQNIWVDSHGIGYTPDGKPVVRLVGDGKGTIVDYETGEVRDDLIVIDPKKRELLWDPNNPDRILGTLSKNGEYYNKEGKLLFKVDRNGNITSGIGGWQIPVKPGENFGIWEDGESYFKDCAMYDLKTHEKVATLMADGQLLDERGNLYAMVRADGSVWAPNGASRGKISGYNLNLQECGLPPDDGSGATTGGRTIKIGNEIYNVGQDGIVTDQEGRIKATLDGGRLWTLDGKPVDTTGKPPRPPKPTPPKINPEQLEEIQTTLAKKRQDMRQRLGGSPLVMSQEMQARYKVKKDKDWASIGIEKGSVSSWPVDMTHVILQGRAIPAVLARSIDSRFADNDALAIVDTNIYAEEGRNILIPAGSQLIGTYGGESSSEPGVAKINIFWNRLIRPDGVSFNLGGSSSGDVMGRGGISAFLDEQLVSKYSTALGGTLAQSLIAFMIATNEDAKMSDSGNSSKSNKAEAANKSRDAFVDTFGQILDDWVSHGEQTPSIIYVPIGTRFNVILKQDLWLRTAEDDEESANQEYGAPPTSAQTPNVPSWEENRRKQMDEVSDVKVKSQDKNTNKNVQQKQPSQAKKDAENLATPIYDGMDQTQGEDLQDRVVEPVQSSQTQPIF